jgi:hypothetical protein
MLSSQRPDRDCQIFVLVSSFHFNALIKYCLRREQELHSAVSLLAPTNVLIMRTSGARIEGHCSHLLMLACEHPSFGWS